MILTNRQKQITNWAAANSPRGARTGKTSYLLMQRFWVIHGHHIKIIPWF